MDADRFDALLVALSTAPSRRVALRLLSGLGLAGLFGQTNAKHKKKKKKPCAKTGQKPGKKRKQCCKGLVQDGSGVCVSPTSSPPSAPPPGCTPTTCPPGACGSLPDGCGGMRHCGCPANQICLRSGVCQPCTVTCTGTPEVCGALLQLALSGEGTVYVCPGTYQGNFVLNDAVTIIGSGAGNDPASNTILSANRPGRVLLINAGVGPIDLERLQLTNGYLASGVGAGIWHQGAMLRMTECTVSGNTSESPVGGGGIVSSGTSTLLLTRCAVDANDSIGGTGSLGGGIDTAGTTILTDCEITRNRAAGGGGGIVIEGGSTTLDGSTLVSVNQARVGGGIYVQAGRLDIAATCRVTDNTATPGFGGGIFNQGTAVLAGPDPSPIVVNNCHENCVGTVAKCAVTPISCPP